MIPFQAMLTPLFLELNAMHLTNSRLGLVLFYSTVNLPFGVFVMRHVPADPGVLDEAARSTARTLPDLHSVLRPLVLPGMATTALYAFLAAWTEFLGALTFLTSNNLYTLPVSLVNIQLGGVRRGELRVPGGGRRDRHDPVRRSSSSPCSGTTSRG